MAGVRVSTRMWDDPEWLTLSTHAQWLWFAVRSFSSTGDYTVERIARKTGRSVDYIQMAELELRGSTYDAILDATRRRQPIARTVIEFIFDRDGRACLHCGGMDRLTIDHIWPVSRGGTDDVENLQTLCQSCNSRKGAKV